MSKSAFLRHADVRAVYELVGQCREVGDDPHRWRRHWYGRLAELTGAELVIGGETAWTDDGRMGLLGTAEWGWENGLDRCMWLRILSENSQDFTSFPQFAAYFGCSRAGDGEALSRKDLMTDAEWYRSWVYQGAFAPIGIDHSLLSFVRMPGREGGFSGVSLGRALDTSRDFGRRARVLVRETHTLLAPLVGGPLARFTEPSPSDLSPRVREVLKCLLEGDGDKQVAARLGISPHTVNVHTKAIFLHFGVRGRAELLARWIRRGWSSRCAWADER
jgi:DNA-binding CsgD family transcriptional regulator